MTTGLRAASDRATAVLLVCVPLVFTSPELQATQAVDLKIDGLVVSGPDSVPRAEIDVELHQVTTDSGGIVDETISRADGTFRFSVARDEDSGAVWLAVARHLGVSYFGPPVHSGADPPSPYAIQVFDTTIVTSPQDADLVARRVVVTPAVDAAGRTSVAEVMDVRGPRDRALVRGAPGEPVWETLLPAGASAFAALPGGVPVEALSRRGDTLSVAAALTPMGLRIAVRYLVPSGPLRLPAQQAASEFVLLVDESLCAAEVRGLARESQGSVSESPSSAMARFSGAGVGKGQVVHVILEGGRSSEPAAGWVWMGVGALLTAVAAASAWRARRRSVGTQV